MAREKERARRKLCADAFSHNESAGFPIYLQHQRNTKGNINIFQRIHSD